METKKLTLEDVIKELKKEIVLELFDKKEDEQIIYWSIKKKYIEHGLIDFLKTQYEIYDKQVDYSEYYREIEKAKTFGKILKLAKKPLGQNFHSLHRPSYLRIDRNWKDVNDPAHKGRGLQCKL